MNGPDRSPIGVRVVSTPPHSTTTEADALPARPGLAKALGVSHLVIATLSSLVQVVSLVWIVILASSRAADGPSSAMFGMDDPRYMTFIVVDAVTGLIVHGLTFASGVGLVNLRAWGARIWRWLAPVEIVRVVVVWGVFIVAVAPALASNMGQSVAKIMQEQAPGRTLLQNAAQLSLVYAWMFLAFGIGMIVLGAIYPAVTWWLVGRRSIRSALVESESAPIPASPSNLEALLP